MVSDNFLDHLIGHRLHESVKSASRHLQLVEVSVVAHKRVSVFDLDQCFFAGHERLSNQLTVSSGLKPEGRS
jgi:hypothetical protein